MQERVLIRSVRKPGVTKLVAPRFADILVKTGAYTREDAPPPPPAVVVRPQVLAMVPQDTAKPRRKRGKAAAPAVPAPAAAKPKRRTKRTDTKAT